MCWRMPDERGREMMARDGVGMLSSAGGSHVPGRAVFREANRRNGSKVVCSGECFEGKGVEGDESAALT